MNTIFRILAKHTFNWFILPAFLLINSESVWAIDINEQDSLKTNIETKTKIRTECKNICIIDILSKANDYSFKDISTAFIYTDIALEKALLLNNKDSLFNVLIDIGFIYEDNGLYPEAVTAYEKTFELAKSMPDSMQQFVLNDLAIANRKAKNYRASYGYYDRLLEMAQKSGKKKELAEVFHGLGRLYREGNVYDKAIDNYLKSLNYSVIDNDTNDIVSSHNDLADAYLRAQYFDKARAHIEKSYTLAQLHSSSHFRDEEINFKLASTLANYGDILSALKDYDNALKKYEAALLIYQTGNSKIRITHILLKLAGLYREQKQFDKAARKFKECAINEMHFAADDRVEFHFQLGSMYQLQGKTPAAEQEYLKCLNLAQKNEFKDFAQQANYKLFLIAFDRKDNGNAIKYLTASNSLRDTLFNIDKSRHIAEMELKYDAEKRENDIRSYKLRENRFVLVSGAFVFMLVVLFLGLIIQMRGRNYQSLKIKNEEIERQNKKLEESNEILTQFAYVAAHDLKEPLRSIGSYIGLLQMKYAKDLPPDAKDYMQFINAGVKRMYNLLTDLLELSQIISTQAGAEVVRPEEVIEDVKANLRNAIELKNAVIEYNPDMPSVRMNKLHLMQLFQNLIGNALKFTTLQPVITVHGKQHEHHIVLSVKDNGIGIKKEFGGKIFVLFQQLNKKGLFDGTGIGLTICKNIVEKYNGTIWFDSVEGEGTTFFISIPT